MKMKKSKRKNMSRFRDEQFLTDFSQNSYNRSNKAAIFIFFHLNCCQIMPKPRRKSSWVKLNFFEMRMRLVSSNPFVFEKVLRGTRMLSRPFFIKLQKS
jgi:hypothetical protein